MVEDKKEKTPEELVKDASDSIVLYKAVFKKFAYNLTKKHSGTRVLDKLLFADYFDVDLIGQHEEELFDIAQKVVYNKVLIQQYIEKNGFEKYKELLEESKNGKKE